LFDPRVSVPVGQFLPMAHIAGPAGSATDAAPLTGAAVRAGSNLPGLTFTNATVTIPTVGRYMLTTSCFSAAITASPGNTLGANTADVKIIDANVAPAAAGFQNNVEGLTFRLFDVTAPNGVINVTGGTGVVAGTFDVIVTQLSSGLTVIRAEEKQQKVEDQLSALIRACEKAGISTNPMEALGAARASADGQPRRPYVAVEVDSDGESVLVSASGKVLGIGTKDEKTAVPNGMQPTPKRK